MTNPTTQTVISLMKTVVVCDPIQRGDHEVTRSGYTQGRKQDSQTVPTVGHDSVLPIGGSTLNVTIKLIFLRILNTNRSAFLGVTDDEEFHLNVTVSKKMFYAQRYT